MNSIAVGAQNTLFHPFGVYLGPDHRAA
jgi:hypothetical protein